MPDAHMPDPLIDDLRRENARLVHCNDDLTRHAAECDDRLTQIAKALTQAVDEITVLKRQLGMI